MVKLRNPLRSLLSPMLVALAMGTLVATAAAIAPYGEGSYATPLASGRFAFVPAKAMRVGYIGTITVGSRRYLGNLLINAAGVSVNWIYGNTYNPAGSALLTPMPDGSYAGTIHFYNQPGRIIDQGTATLRITLR